MDISDEMQHQARALADPSRFQLFRHIAEADRPVGVAELTELMGFNHNAIRQHLAVLVDGGLVAEATERRTVRGRPRKEYTPRSDALSAFRSVTGSYERLAGLLLAMATSGRDPYDVGYRAGLGEATAVDAADAVDQLVRQLAIEGFEPTHADDVVVLANCPFADVAAKDPGVICALHRGLIDGHLQANHDELSGELSPRDPQRAGCEIVVIGPSPNT